MPNQPITRAQAIDALGDYLKAVASNTTADYDATQAVAFDGVDDGGEVAFELADHLGFGRVGEEHEEAIMSLAEELAPLICQLAARVVAHTRAPKS